MKTKDLRSEVIAALKARGFRCIEKDTLVGSSWVLKPESGAARYFNGKVVVDVTGYLVVSHPLGQCDRKRSTGFEAFLLDLTKEKTAA